MQEERHSHAGRRLAVSLGVSALAIVLLSPMASAAPPRTKLASQSSAEIQANDDSSDSDISATGRFVVFESRASNLVGGDDNGDFDVFIRDFKKGKTKLISAAPDGGVSNGFSGRPSVSAGGRFVAFLSSSTDLIPGGTNGERQVFVRDRFKNKTELISRSSAGVEGDSSSADPVISANGRWVAFASSSSNLVAKDTNGKRQIYLFDRKNDKLSLVSRNGAGLAGDDVSNGPAISEDGRFIAYQSRATNLTSKDNKGTRQIFLFDKKKKKTELISKNRKGKAGNGISNDATISANGAKIVFNSLATNFVKDTNASTDAYMRDRGARKTKRVSLNWKGKQLDDGASSPDVSANGRWVTFQSAATNATKASTFPGAYDLIYARNIASGKLKLVSRRAGRANDRSFQPRISKSGAFVTFNSWATNLTAAVDANGADRDIFRRGPIN